MTTPRFLLVCRGLSDEATRRLEAEVTAVLGIGGLAIDVQSAAPISVGTRTEQPKLVVKFGATEALSPREIRVVSSLYGDLPVTGQAAVLWTGLPETHTPVGALDAARWRASQDRQLDWRVWFDTDPNPGLLIHARSADYIEFAADLRDEIEPNSQVVAGGVGDDRRVLLVVNTSLVDVLGVTSAVCRRLHIRTTAPGSLAPPLVLVLSLDGEAFGEVLATFPFDDDATDGLYSRATPLDCRREERGDS